MSSCVHHWSLINVRSGYLVAESCHHCGVSRMFFSPELVSPVEEYQDGPHHWQYVDSSQTISFNMRCDVCGEMVDLGDVVGLMLCTLDGCNTSACDVGRMSLELGRDTSMYVALCSDSTHQINGHCVSGEGIAALNEYFNQRLRQGSKKILVVPCKMCDNVDSCPGVVIADSGLTEL